MIELFKQYIKISRNVSDSTVKHYITAINTINTLLIKNNYPIQNVFDVSSFEELNSIRDYLNSNVEFIKKDTVGNRMYSVAFNHFYRFACEDKDFYTEKLDKLDMVIPKKTISVSNTWKRNKLISAQALEFAHYQCECNNGHKTFIAASNGKQYMEGHHLIPIKFQKDFASSIDVYANIVCLCPVCHRLLHYGTTKEKEYNADKLFEARNERLIHSGIDISRNDFQKIIIA